MLITRPGPNFRLWQFQAKGTRGHYRPTFVISGAILPLDFGKSFLEKTVNLLSPGHGFIYCFQYAITTHLNWPGMEGYLKGNALKRET